MRLSGRPGKLPVCPTFSEEFMPIGKHVNSGSRRSFLKRASWGLTGSLIASGKLGGFSWAQESETSLKIAKVEPHLLTGVRGYGPWLFVRVETADGIVGWGEGTNFHGVKPIEVGVKNLRSVVVGERARNIGAIWER